MASTLTYGLVSCWMYIIGMGAAIYTGEGDIALIMVKAGLGVAALVILILSTVTTTFLDAWSCLLYTSGMRRSRSSWPPLAWGFAPMRRLPSGARARMSGIGWRCV